MAALRPNAAIIGVGWRPISGHCISEVDMADLLDDPVNPLLKPHAQNPPFVQLVPRCQLSTQLKSFWSSLARMYSDIAVT